MNKLPTAYEIVREQSENKDKEIERLRKLVKSAYTEGYHDGNTDIGEIFGWEKSNTQQALREEG